MAHGDKRSVSTDALETLGTIIGQDAGRDAIHIAVEPVMAAHVLRPGDHVGLLPNGRAGYSETPVGIVDPYLKQTVDAGDRFWLLVYPRQITSLRHVWVHPSFPDTTAKPEPLGILAAERDSEILQQGAAAKGIDLSLFMEAIDYWFTQNSGKNRTDSICFGDEIEYNELPPDFWDAYERVTGRTIPAEWREKVCFRCAC